MPKQLAIRGPDDVGERLESISRANAQSVNKTVVSILTKAVGVDERWRRLERYGTWTPAEHDAFEKALQAQREIDDDLWR